MPDEGGLLKETDEPRLIRFSAYQKSLAEFAARRRQRNKIIFSRDMCVRENTAQAASVEFVRLRRTNYARSSLQSFCRKNPEGFSTVSETDEPRLIRFLFQIPLDALGDAVHILQGVHAHDLFLIIVGVGHAL